MNLSFSEFATNEATTSCKNVYYEPNTSDSLVIVQSNDNMNQLRSNLFEQQFENVEMNFTETIQDVFNDASGRKHDMNFTAQIAALDMLPLNGEQTSTNLVETYISENLESRIFPKANNTFAVAETSTVNPIDTKDDLENIIMEVKKSEQYNNSKLFSDKIDVSQLIEVDLDMTHDPAENEESNMSITDTINCPNVQDISKNNTSQDSKKKSISNDWVADKENIVFNPYVTPNESDRFALNVEPEKVLVFTGKKVKYASIDADLDELEESFNRVSNKVSMIPKLSCSQNFVEANVMKEIENVSQSDVFVNKLITDNIDSRAKDIQDNTMENMFQSSTPLTQENKRKTILHETNDVEADISMTQCVPIRQIIGIINKTQEITQDDNKVNMSMTEAAIVMNKSVLQTTKRNTNIFEKSCSETDISITQCLPNKIIENIASSNSKILFSDKIEGNLADITQETKHRTILFENDDFQADISMTKCVPSKQLIENIKSQLFTQNDNSSNKSISDSAIKTSNYVTENKGSTVIFEKNDMESDISFTQCLSNNNVIKNINLQILNLGDEMTNKTENNAHKNISQENEQKTILFENADMEADISMTQCIPNKQIFEITTKKQDDDNRTDKSVIKSAIKMNNDSQITKKNTIVYMKNDIESDDSITQCLSNNVIKNIAFNDELTNKTVNQGHITQENKRRTILFENTDVEADISMTQCVSTKELIENVMKPQLFEQNDNITNKSMSDSAVKVDIYVPENKRGTIIFDNNSMDAEISITQCLPDNKISEIIESSINLPILNSDEMANMRTILFEHKDVESEISLTKCIPTKQLFENDNKILQNENENNESMPELLVNQFEPKKNRTNKLMTESTIDIDDHISQTKKSQIVFEKNYKIETNISIIQCLSNNKVIDNDLSRKSQILNSDEIANLVVYADPMIQENKRRTILFENKDMESDISLTKCIPTKQLFEKDNKMQYETNESLSESTINMDSYIPQTKKSPVGFDKNDNMETNISFTKCLSNNKIIDNILRKKSQILNSDEIDNVNPYTIQENKLRTIVFENKDIESDISLTKCVPTKHLFENDNKRHNENGNEPMTKPAIEMNDYNSQTKRSTIIFEQNDNMLTEVSITQCLSNNKIITPSRNSQIITSDEKANMAVSEAHLSQENKQRTIIFKNDVEANISMTQCIPSNKIHMFKQSDKSDNEMNNDFDKDDNVKADLSREGIENEFQYISNIMLHREHDSLEIVGVDKEEKNANVTMNIYKNDNISDMKMLISDDDYIQTTQQNFTQTRKSEMFAYDKRNTMVEEIIGGINIDMPLLKTSGNISSIIISKEPTPHTPIRMEKKLLAYSNVLKPKTSPVTDNLVISLNETHDGDNRQTVEEGAKDHLTDKLVDNEAVEVCNDKNLVPEPVFKEVDVQKLNCKKIKYSSFTENLDKLDEPPLKRRSNEGIVSNILIGDEPMSTNNDIPNTFTGTCSDGDILQEGLSCHRQTLPINKSIQCVESKIVHLRNKTLLLDDNSIATAIPGMKRKIENTINANRTDANIDIDADCLNKVVQDLELSRVLRRKTLITETELASEDIVVLNTKRNTLVDKDTSLIDLTNEHNEKCIIKDDTNVCEQDISMTEDKGPNSDFSLSNEIVSPINNEVTQESIERKSKELIASM